MADASVYVMEKVNFSDVCPATGNIRNTHINIGTGKELSIHDVAFLIREKVGFEGNIVFDPTKPDGTMRKLTVVTKLHALGWSHSIEIDEGVERLYDWYLKTQKT